MILILSISSDRSTSDVIDWLNCFEKKYIRINYEDLYSAKLEINNLNKKIELLGNFIIDLKKITSYWYRRGNIDIKTELFTEPKQSESNFNKYYKSEAKYIQRYIHYFLKTNTFSVNSYDNVFVNKLEVLDKAKKLGLKIPATLITNLKKELNSFINKHSEIITKSVREGFSFEFLDTNYYLHTILLTKSDIKNFPEKFNHLLVQENLNKKYELRIFYLNGSFFASAIFSQNDEQTKIDFRNYNQEKPNRVVPFTLPVEIRSKLLKLMRELKLESGSIDVIVTKKNEFIFLEVNPIGQFHQVSDPCNYYLEKEIALSLINHG